MAFEYNDATINNPHSHLAQVCKKSGASAWPLACA